VAEEIFTIRFDDDGQDPLLPSPSDSAPPGSSPDWADSKEFWDEARAFADQLAKSPDNPNNWPKDADELKADFDRGYVSDEPDAGPVTPPPWVQNPGVPRPPDDPAWINPGAAAGMPNAPEPPEPKGKFDPRDWAAANAPIPTEPMDLAGSESRAKVTPITGPMGMPNVTLDDARKLSGAASGVKQAASASTASGIVGAGTQLAASGVLGSQAAALAAGPVGMAAAAAAMVVDVAAGKIADGVKALEKGIRTAGQGIQQFAGNDHIGMLETATDAAAAGLEKIPVVGQIWAAELQLATSVVTTFADVMDSFVQRGQQLARLDSSLAYANADADVKRLLADIEEADKLGKDMARITESQVDMEILMREILMPLKQALTAGVADFADAFKELMEAIRPLIEPSIAVAKVVVQADMAGLLYVIRTMVFLLEMANAPGKLMKHLMGTEDKEKKAKDDDELNSIMSEFLGLNKPIPGENNPPGQNWPQFPRMPFGNV